MSSAAAIAGEDFFCLFCTMSYILLKSLLPLIESFERAYPAETDPLRFAAWLSLQDNASRKAPAELSFEGDGALLQLLGFFNRYVRGYARKALEGSPLHSIDEFAYLAALQAAGSLTKSALIQQQRHEKPTGMEIIKRLLELGLLAQHDDPGDRRSKRLSLTPQGEQLVSDLVPNMQQVARIAAGNLNPLERAQLLQLLQKLEAFHQVVQAKIRG